MKSNRDDIINVIKKFSGQANVIAIPRVFIDITGSMELAAMLNQLIYWSDRAVRKDGMVYKSSKDWMNELGVTDYAVRRFKELPYVNYVNHRVNNAPTSHYSVDFNELINRIVENTKPSVENNVSELVENNDSLTETTHKTTTYIKELPQNDSEPFSIEPERIPVIYANNEYVEVDEIKEVKPKHGANYKSLMSAVASVCRMDIGIKTQAGQVGKAARELDEGGYTPDQVYDFLDWWKREDWRWQKEKRNPSPHEILTTISRSIVKAEPKMTDEELRRIGYIE
jgi:hypothetical protein